MSHEVTINNYPHSFLSTYISAGISIHYLLNQALIFWVVHIVAILWLVAFPAEAKRLESSGYYKIIHSLVLVIALVLPIGFVAAPLGTGGFKPFYYPNTCVARNSDVAYYALVLPDSILSAIGVSLLVLLLWILLRKKWPDIFAKLSRKSEVSVNTDYDYTFTYGV